MKRNEKEATKQRGKNTISR